MTTLSNITINYLQEPVGIAGSIQLGWVLESDHKNVKQASYRIRVYCGEVLVHDGGTVQSQQSTNISLCLPWQSLTRYTVRVQVTAGGESAEGETHFVTGLQTADEWRGQFISAEPESDKDKSYGTLVRKEFCLEKPVKEAWLVCSAHGLYRPFLNGQRVSADEMAPGWTSYNKRLLYQTYEVTSLLHEGQNVLGVHLGAGWYKGTMSFKHTRNNYGTRTAFGGQLLLRYTDGAEEWLCTDESWQGSKSPVLFSEIYDGEVYDARLEQSGWCESGFDAEGWQPVQAVARNVHTLVPQNGCPVRVHERFAPKALLTTPQGDRVLDFGQNMTGRCEITLQNTKSGDVAELEFFEVLDADGNVYTENLRGIHQIMRYTCRGGTNETYCPCFTFHGFRYAKVVSWPGELRLQDFTACVLHSDMEPTGSFACSDERVNQLWHNILWGMKGNFLDIPTDCPQRDERLGWTGDVQAFGRTSCYLMNTEAFYRKWLADLSADQTKDGAVTHVVPDILSGNTRGDWLLDQDVQGGASGWADVAVILPWTLYQAYGDTEILRRQLPSMLAWLDFMEKHSDGCLYQYGAQFGDWLALDAAPGSYKGATPDEYTSAAYYCYSAYLVSRCLAALGRMEDAAAYRKKAEALREQFRKRFFAPDGTLAVQTQTAHVLALAFGLVPEQHREKTAARLCELVRENGGHLTTGFMGTPYLMQALSENGGLDETYGLLLKDDFPSWLYQVKMGATTVWEHWDGIRPDGSMWSADMNSFNHYSYGSVGDWLVRTVAGLEIDESRPGFEHFFLRPRIGGGLTEAEADYQSIHGKIAVQWQREGDTVTLAFTIPANTSADIVLPQAKEMLACDGLTFTLTAGGLRAESGSGTYRIQYRI